MDIVTTHFYSNSLTIEKQTHAQTYSNLQTNIRILYYNRFRIINKKRSKFLVYQSYFVYFLAVTGLLPSRTFTTMRTNTILDIYQPGLLPSRTFTTMRTNTIPDKYHPGHLPSRPFTTNPDFYHPGHLPSRTFTTMRTNTIPDIYHNTDIYHPVLLPIRDFMSGVLTTE